MPTGFDVETGSDLSERLQKIASIIADHLKRSREKQNRGPNNPIIGAALLTWIKADYNIDLSGADIRAIVNFLRRNKKPIGSNQDGYFWAVNIAELNFTRQHLRERISAIKSALDGIEAAFDDKDQTLL